MGFPRQESGVGSHFLLQGIFLTQGSNSRLLCCRYSPALQADSLPTEPPEKPKKLRGEDFPGGPVVRNLPQNAWDAGSIPGRGTEIPHATGQLSLCATPRAGGFLIHRMPLVQSLKHGAPTLT